MDTDAGHRLTVSSNPILHSLPHAGRSFRDDDVQLGTRSLLLQGNMHSTGDLLPSLTRGCSQLGICSLPLQGDAVNWGFAPFPYKGTKSTGDFLPPTTREHSQSGTDSLPLQGDTVKWGFALSPTRQHSQSGTDSIPLQGKSCGDLIFPPLEGNTVKLGIAPSLYKGTCSQLGTGSLLPTREHSQMGICSLPLQL